MSKIVVVALIATLSASMYAQDSAPASASQSQQASIPRTTTTDECGLKGLKACALDVIHDEGGIIASPFHAKKSDLKWIVPFAVVTGVAIGTDSTAVHDLGVHPTREKDLQRISDATGLYGPIIAAGAFYGIGAWRSNPHLRETGILAAEAMIDGALLNTGLKYAFDRQRPMTAGGNGYFYPNGLRTYSDGTSMPSGHAVEAWSFARVVAAEYPGWETKVTVYGLATLTSVSRVIGREHFPSDVIVGSSLGYLVGTYVVHHHGRYDKAGVMSRLSVGTSQTANGNGVAIAYSFTH